ncbi:MAG: VWA domain-containing protein, partial [Candidatus Kapabacteria bacterium]|nr:VWA domain-containing protein [Candidatus Kapabacteria bacterium]
MKNLIIAVILLYVLALALPVQSQTLFRNFYLYNVDTSRYPTMTASIYAQDSLGQSTLRLNINEITLTENGQPRSGLTMVCDSLPTPIPVAACLTLDQSWSMADRSPSGDTYWQWVKDGAKAFINRLQFVPPTQVAITSFGGTSYVRSQFQQTRPPLLSTIDQIPNEGSTDYDEAFLNLSVQGGTNGNIYVLKNAPPSLRRICIFLTDGQPDNAPLKQRIIDSCLRHNITVYAINVFNPRSTTIHPDLVEICSTTGGKSYLVRSKAELIRVFEDIAVGSQVNVACRISWQSFSGCGEASRNRTLTCTVRRGTRSNTWTGRYIAPEISVASPDAQPSTLLFNDPGQGGTVQQTFSIRASQRIPLTITGYTFQPNNGRFRIVSSSKPLPATLQPNESMDVTVEFTQDVLGKIYRATLKTVSTPCIDSVALVVNIPTIKLESPVGGEKLDGCDSISIRWSGVPADEPVILSYSTNKGTDWIPITNAATGLEYKWFKRTPGADYMMRVQRLSCQWVSRFGGSGLDSGVSVTWNRKARNVLVGGSFSDTLQTGVSTLNAVQRDGVLLWMNSSGIPTRAVHIQGSGMESVDAVATDSNYHYLAAITTTSTQLQCGLKILPLLNSTNRSGVVARIDSTGNTIWMAGVSSETPGSGDVIASSVFVRKDSMMFLQGYAQGLLKTYHLSDTVPSLKLDMPVKPGVYFPFTAEIDPRGRIVALIQRHTYPIEARRTNTASNGNTMYEVSSQSAPVRCNANTLASKGGLDIVVRAVQGDPVVSQSQRVFSIMVPRLKFSLNSFSMWAEDVGKSYLTPFGTASILGNDGNKDIPAVTSSLIGRDQADFQLIKGASPFPLSTSNIESYSINFSPRAVPYKPRECYLVTEAPCSDPEYVRVSAFANF